MQMQQARQCGRSRLQQGTVLLPPRTRRAGARPARPPLATSRPATSTVAVRAALIQQDHQRRVAAPPQQQGTTLSMLGALSLLAVNAATFAPKAQLLPQLLVHSLGVGFLVKSWQDLSSARNTQKDRAQAPEVAPVVAAAPPAPSASDEKSKVVLQMEAALCEATRVAQREAAEAANMACMARALRHTNANLSKQLREERMLRMQQRLRIERLHRELSAAQQPQPASPLLAVTCDPAIERAVLQMVQSEEVRAMEQQLSVMRQELLAARAQLERERARADACEAAATHGSRNSHQ